MGRRFFMSVFLKFLNIFSIVFDGVIKYINLGDIANFERNQAFSISMWIKTSQTSTAHLINRIKNSTPFTGWQFYKDPAQKLTFSLINDSSTNTIQVNGSSTSINDGQWHHIVMTYDGSSNASGVRIYIDAVVETMNISLDTLSQSTLVTQNALMGKRSDNTGYYNGKLDEPAIYDKELSPSEVTTVYNSGKVRNLKRLPSPSNLYSWLRFTQEDKDNFPTMTDYSGNGRDATTVNFIVSNIQGDVF